MPYRPGACANLSAAGLLVFFCDHWRASPSPRRPMDTARGSVAVAQVLHLTSKGGVVAPSLVQPRNLSWRCRVNRKRSARPAPCCPPAPRHYTWKSTPRNVAERPAFSARAREMARAAAWTAPQRAAGLAGTDSLAICRSPDRAERPRTLALRGPSTPSPTTPRSLSGVRPSDTMVLTIRRVLASADHAGDERAVGS